MKHFASSVGLILLVASLLLTQVEVVEGKKSGYAKGRLDALTDSYAVALGEVTLGKAKKKQVLIVEGDVHLTEDAQSGPMPQVFGLLLRVNGKIVSAGGTAEIRKDCSGFRCTHGWTWWIDLDEMEETFPGEILKQPLVVGLHASENTGAGGPWCRANFSMTARLEKK